MSNLIEKAAEKHQTWINIVNSFGCPKNISEDIVQEMYLKINNKGYLNLLWVYIKNR